MSQQHTIILKNGPLEFTTLSNFTSKDVYTTSNRKWNRVVLLLHGFPDEHHTWDGVWDKLLAGFGSKTLLLAPTMRGYERSSQPENSSYNVADIAKDVRAWIISLNVSRVPVHVVGHDWGAVIAFKTASLYPDLITSLVCMSIPYIVGIRAWTLLWAAPIQLWLSSYFLTMQSSLLYFSALRNTKINSYLDRLWKYWSPTWDFTQKDIAGTKALFSDKTVVHSTTAYYRAIMNPLNLPLIFWRINFNKVPTLVLGGQVDGCMDARLFQLSKEHFKDEANFEVNILPQRGHFLQREAPDAVANHIIDWFKKYHTAK